MPAQPEPVVSSVPEDPLRLTDSMRARLRAAVLALVNDPSLAGASDGARLGVVVLAAKAEVRANYRTAIWAEELGRWLGVSLSSVAHTVLPELRKAEMVGSRVVTDAEGHPTGLDCWVVPMYRAQKAGDRRHPLALTRPELSVLLGLCEALFGPGWTRKGKEPVPSGLLAGRTGRGAATDRLGLLLMVLSTTSKGWLRLCPGSVDKDRGRPAATVARLLGCSPAGGAKVLARLQERGVARVERPETVSGLKHTSRVCVVPVAEAHDRIVRESRRGAGPVFSDLAAAASGDLETGVNTESAGQDPFDGMGQGEFAGFGELAGTAQHHAFHACGVSVVGDDAARGGFSGEAPLVDPGPPEHAYAGGDQVADGTPGPRLTLVDSSGDPLRGEQPEKSDVDQRAQEQGQAREQLGAAARVLAHFTAGHNQQQHQGRMPRPPVDVETVVAPVGWLWARLDREGARRTVVNAVRRELATVAGVTGSGRASQVLAERLTRRLADQGGPARVTDPVGWLLGRGLPRRADCGDVRCDEGLRMDTGQECWTCGYVLADRRGLRHQVAAKVDAAMPNASPEQRRTATEQLLRDAIAQQPSDAEHHQEQEREGPPRGACRDCGCRIFLTGPALTDGLCKLCRREAAAANATTAPAAEEREPVTCAGRDGVPCTRTALPTRTVCARHRAQELDAAEKTGAA